MLFQAVLKTGAGAEFGREPFQINPYSEIQVVSLTYNWATINGLRFDLRTSNPNENTYLLSGDFTREVEQH